MTDRHSLICFLALVAAICYLASVAAVLAARAQYAEALGFGGLTTGLVGVLGTFKPRSTAPDQAQPVTVTNSDHNPVKTEEAS